jgi:hypothetical protein
MLPLLVDNTVNASEMRTDLKSVIFVAVFVLVCMGVAMWWLRR